MYWKSVDENKLLIDKRFSETIIAVRRTGITLFWERVTDKIGIHGTLVRALHTYSIMTEGQNLNNL